MNGSYKYFKPSNNGVGVDRDSGCEYKWRNNGNYNNVIRGDDYEFKWRQRVGNDKRKSGERDSNSERRSYNNRRLKGEDGSRSELYFRNLDYKTRRQNEYSRGNGDWDVDYRRQARNSAGWRSYPSFRDRGQSYSGYPTQSRKSPFPSHRREGARDGERRGDKGVGRDGRREARRTRLDFPGRDRKERGEREPGSFEEKKRVKGWVTGQPVAKRMREEEQGRDERKKEERRQPTGRESSTDGGNKLQCGRKICYSICSFS